MADKRMQLKFRWISATRRQLRQYLKTHAPPSAGAIVVSNVGRVAGALAAISAIVVFTRKQGNRENAGMSEEFGPEQRSGEKD